MLKPKKPKKFTLDQPPTEQETHDTLQENEPARIIPGKKVDGRTLRRTGRTAQLNVLLSPEFREQFTHAAEMDRLTHPQLLTLMFRAYSELSSETKNTYIQELMATWGK